MNDQQLQGALFGVGITTFAWSLSDGHVFGVVVGAVVTIFAFWSMAKSRR